MCPKLLVCIPSIRIYFRPRLTTFISDRIVAWVECCYLGWLVHWRHCRKRSRSVTRQGPTRSGSCTGTAYTDIGISNVTGFWNSFPSPMKVSSLSRAISKLNKKLTNVTILWGGSQTDLDFTNNGWAIKHMLNKLVALEIERTLVSFVVSCSGKTIFWPGTWYQVPDTKEVSRQPSF